MSAAPPGASATTAVAAVASASAPTLPAAASSPSSSSATSPSAAAPLFASAVSMAQSMPALPAAAALAPAQSVRRNKDLHAKFPEIPESELLIDDYICALSRGPVPIQGRLYLTHRRLCFYSAILGTVHRVVLYFEDVENLKRRVTVGFIPNAIEVVSGPSSFIFQSFLSRDAAFDKMDILWKQALAASPEHPPHTGAIVDEVNVDDIIVPPAIAKGVVEGDADGMPLALPQPVPNASDSSLEFAEANASGSLLARRDSSALALGSGADAEPCAHEWHREQGSVMLLEDTFGISVEAMWALLFGNQGEGPDDFENPHLFSNQRFSVASDDTIRASEHRGFMEWFMTSRRGLLAFQQTPWTQPRRSSQSQPNDGSQHRATSSTSSSIGDPGSITGTVEASDSAASVGGRSSIASNLNGAQSSSSANGRSSSGSEGSTGTLPRSRRRGSDKLSLARKHLHIESPCFCDIRPGYTRTVMYDMPLGIYTAKNVLYDTVRARDGDNSVCVRTVSTSAGVPFAGAYQNILSCCILALPSESPDFPRCRVVISYQVEFDPKTQWMVRTTVSQAIKSRITEYYSDLGLVLQDYTAKKLELAQAGIGLPDDAARQAEASSAMYGQSAAAGASSQADREGFDDSRGDHLPSHSSQPERTADRSQTHGRRASAQHRRRRSTDTHAPGSSSSSRGDTGLTLRSLLKDPNVTTAIHVISVLVLCCVLVVFACCVLLLVQELSVLARRIESLGVIVADLRRIQMQMAVAPQAAAAGAPAAGAAESAAEAASTAVAATSKIAAATIASGVATAAMLAAAASATFAPKPAVALAQDPAPSPARPGQARASNGRPTHAEL
ncbi:hypothetical protein HK105_203370 [Polyrhizophydium stewartii]|uniref:VASt domain-containing protein n=1 Tax=Polyrhizophydium stewartii TaxID=2732419 RepID=A0ABR4NBP9_9FUNG